MATLIRKCEVNTNGLSTREIEILKMRFNDMTDKQIANYLKISPHTIKTYKTRILTKKHTNSIDNMFDKSEVNLYVI